MAEILRLKRNFYVEARSVSYVEFVCILMLCVFTMIGIIIATRFIPELSVVGSFVFMIGEA
uniref:Uncharacterized protein n=1 Tax=Romanomermis culicivorax TaxID=13658 RepID=A0A915ISI6_ROMCU